MTEYDMSCPRCGGLLDDHGVCANCGPSQSKRSVDGVTTTRTSAHIDAPEGGAVLAGEPDSLGVFQAAGQPTNWFVRITTVGVTAVFLIVIGVLFLIAIGGVFAGFALLGNGALGAVIGLFVIGGASLVALVIVVGFSIVSKERKKNDRPA